jgi:hypothetical protein
MSNAIKSVLRPEDQFPYMKNIAAAMSTRIRSPIDTLCEVAAGGFVVIAVMVPL